MIVYFVRHGQTGANKLGLNAILGNDEVLNLVGREQVEKTKLLQGLGTQGSLIISSPLMRARKTAEIIASQTKSRVKIDKNASEVGWGEWTGKPITEVIASWRGIIE